MVRCCCCVLLHLLLLVFIVNILFLFSPVTCVESDGSNIVELWQAQDFHFQVLVVFDLSLKLRQLGVLLHELLNIRLTVLLPDGVDALPGGSGGELLQCSCHLLQHRKHIGRVWCWNRNILNSVQPSSRIVETSS